MAIFKSICVIGLATYCFLSGFVSDSFAAQKLETEKMEHWEIYTWQQKLHRAGSNLIAMPAEISYAFEKYKKENGTKQAWTSGVLEGFGYGVARFWYGLVEGITFPFGFPDEDKVPLMEPEYVWERPKI